MAEIRPVLALLAVLHAAGEGLDVERLAAEGRLDVDDVLWARDQIQALGLCLMADGEVPPVPMVTDAGRQLLGGYEPSAAGIQFLAGCIDRSPRPRRARRGDADA